MNLADGQKLFWQMLERRADSAELAKVFAASAEVPLEERANVYAEAYVWRQIEALREDFPQTKAYLGCDGFDAVAQAFVYARPSRHPSLAKRGNGFAEYLRASDAVGVTKRLGDLAALEWSRCLIFDAAASDTVTMAALQQPGVEMARVLTITALSVLALTHPVVELWRALNQESPLPEDSTRPEHVLVWRAADVVYHVAVQADEAAAMRAAMASQTIAEICACFAEHENPAQRAGAVLAHWFAEGMIAAVLMP